MSAVPAGAGAGAGAAAVAAADSGARRGTEIGNGTGAVTGTRPGTGTGTVTGTRPGTGTGRAGGSVTAEFALVLVLFMVLACGILEVGRLMYLFNALQMVTQRAAVLAANADFSDPAKMRDVRLRAVWRTTPGTLAMGAPVSEAHVRIDYLSMAGGAGALMTPMAAGAMPSCPANNRIGCMKDPYSASCIRLVRVRICDPADTEVCQRSAYLPMFPLVALAVRLPQSTAIVVARTLGAAPGDPPCP